jgi:hypothetical protein
MTIVLIAFVGGFAVGVLGAVVFTVYLGARVAQETTNGWRAAADWSGGTVWEVVASDEVDCSQFGHRLKLRPKGTLHALGLPESAGAAMVPAPDVAAAATHFHQPAAESQSASVDDVVLADERRRGGTHAFALVVAKPVDTRVGATEPVISLTPLASPNAATSVTPLGDRSRRQRGGDRG